MCGGPAVSRSLPPWGCCYGAACVSQTTGRCDPVPWAAEGRALRELCLPQGYTARVWQADPRLSVLISPLPSRP